MSQYNKSPAKNEKKDELLKEVIMGMFNSKNEISEAKEDVKPIDEVSKKWNMNDRITNLFADKIESDTKLKGRYAIILIAILIIQLVTLNIFFVLKGCNVLKYADTTFNIFITGGIAEIFVLVRIIVKYLFNDNLTELLKIILKANNASNGKYNPKRENIIKNKKD